MIPKRGKFTIAQVEKAASLGATKFDLDEIELDGLIYNALEKYN